MGEIILEFKTKAYKDKNYAKKSKRCAEKILGDQYEKVVIL